MSGFILGKKSCLNNCLRLCEIFDDDNIYFLEAKNSLDQAIIYGYTYYNWLTLLVLVIYKQGAFVRSPQKTHSDSIENYFFKYRKPFNQRII